jgi:hypothetical protein
LSYGRLRRKENILGRARDGWCFFSTRLSIRKEHSGSIKRDIMDSREMPVRTSPPTPITQSELDLMPIGGENTRQPELGSCPSRAYMWPIGPH